MQADASLCRAVLNEVRRVRESHQSYQGDTAVVVAGPGGTWTIKQYQNDRGYFNLNVKSPAGRVYYSLQSVEHFFNAQTVSSSDDDVLYDLPPITVNGDQLLDYPPEDPPAVPELVPVLMPDMDDKVTLRAGLRIATSYRAFKIRKAWGNARALQEELKRIGAALASTSDFLESAAPTLVASSNAEYELARANPQLQPLMVRYPVVTSVMHSVEPLPNSLLTIMIRPSDLSRDQVAMHTTAELKKIRFDIHAPHGARAKATALAPRQRSRPQGNGAAPRQRGRPEVAEPRQGMLIEAWAVRSSAQSRARPDGIVEPEDGGVQMREGGQLSPALPDHHRCTRCATTRHRRCVPFAPSHPRSFSSTSHAGDLPLPKAQDFKYISNNMTVYVRCTVRCNGALNDSLPLTCVAFLPTGHRHRGSQCAPRQNLRRQVGGSL